MGNSPTHTCGEYHEQPADFQVNDLLELRARPRGDTEAMGNGQRSILARVEKVEYYRQNPKSETLEPPTAVVFNVLDPYADPRLEADDRLKLSVATHYGGLNQHDEANLRSLKNAEEIGTLDGFFLVSRPGESLGENDSGRDDDRETVPDYAAAFAQYVDTKGQNTSTRPTRKGTVRMHYYGDHDTIHFRTLQKLGWHVSDIDFAARDVELTRHDSTPYYDGDY